MTPLAMVSTSLRRMPASFVFFSMAIVFLYGDTRHVLRNVVADLLPQERLTVDDVRLDGQHFRDGGSYIEVQVVRVEVLHLFDGGLAGILDVFRSEVFGFVGQFTGLPHDAVEELVGVFDELVHVEVLDGLDRLLGRLLEHFCQFLLIIIHDRSIGSFRFDRTYVIAHRARRQVLSSPLRSWTSWWRGGRWCGSR